MKKVIISLILVGYTLSAEVKNDSLLQAIKDADVERVKELIAEKAHMINPDQIKKAIGELEEKAHGLIHKEDIPWYKRFKALVKTGVGLTGVILAGRFMINAMEDDQENLSWDLVSRFFKGKPSSGQLENMRTLSSRLCMASSAVAIFSSMLLWSGFKELRQKHYKSRIGKVINLVKDGYNVTKHLSE